MDSCQARTMTRSPTSPTAPTRCSTACRSQRAGRGSGCTVTRGPAGAPGLCPEQATPARDSSPCGQRNTQPRVWYQKGAECVVVTHTHTHIVCVCGEQEKPKVAQEGRPDGAHETSLPLLPASLLQGVVRSTLACCGRRGWSWPPCCGRTP